MTIQPAILVPTAPLAATVAAIYTTPANGQSVVRRAVFTNIDTLPHIFTVHRVPNSGSESDANIVIFEQRLAPGQAYASPELANMVLNGGDSLRAFADTVDVVNVTISGFTS